MNLRPRLLRATMNIGNGRIGTELMKPVSVLYNNTGSAFGNPHHMVVMGAFALCWWNASSGRLGRRPLFWGVPKNEKMNNRRREIKWWIQSITIGCDYVGVRVFHVLLFWQSSWVTFKRSLMTYSFIYLYYTSQEVHGFDWGSAALGICISPFCAAFLWNYCAFSHIAQRHAQ